jgi:hypothetical protein
LKWVWLINQADLLNEARRSIVLVSDFLNAQEEALSFSLSRWF